MLVYHIDKSISRKDNWTVLNTVNADARHQCADLMEADGRKDSYSDYMDFITRRKSICIETIFLCRKSTENMTFS